MRNIVALLVIGALGAAINLPAEAQSKGRTKTKLLDKIVAIFNGQIITLSQIKRVRENLAARKEISPHLYTKSRGTTKDLVDMKINALVVREELSQIGYVIGDEQVEEQIKVTERGLGVNREQLEAFLKSNNMTFDEYFEVIRETIEFNTFSSRIIAPLISVSDQEIKNSFYKQNKKGNTSAFKYSLIDFSLESRFMKGKMLNKFKSVVETYNSNGTLPKSFGKIGKVALGEITEEGLTKQLKDVLHKTDEGSFTTPVLIGSDYHVFLVKKKSIVETESFAKAKEITRIALLEKHADRVTQEWFARKKPKYYIKILI